MKSIMISIKPKWVAKILNGEKTIEIRKTMPKCDLPIDVYIYCTKDNKQRLYPVSLLDKSNQVFKRAYREDKIDNRTNYLNGKVVAKFTLNKVEEVKSTYEKNGIRYDNNLNLKDEDDDQMFTTSFKSEKALCKASCLTSDELWEYLIFGEGYAIHISNLEIFDKPKELSEFYKYMDWAIRSEHMICMFHKCNICKKCQLTKAPQSFMYVDID